MDRRTLFKSSIGAIALLALPKATNAAVTKSEWHEYVLVQYFDEPHLSDAWIELTQHDTEENAKKEFQKLATVKANDVSIREFADTEFLVMDKETRKRNELGDESAAFETDYDNLEIAVMYVRQGTMLVQSAFNMTTDKGFNEAIEILEVTLEHERLPSLLSLLDVTGNDWVVSDQGQS